MKRRKQTLLTVLVSPLLILAATLFTIGVLIKAFSYCLILDGRRAKEEFKNSY